MKDVVQKRFPKAPKEAKEAKGKKKVKTKQVPEDQEGYVNVIFNVI